MENNPFNARNSKVSEIAPSSRERKKREQSFPLFEAIRD
jgi:hypothetical protein